MKIIFDDLDNIPKPFLRWAGGKNWLIKYLKQTKNLTFRNYHEPFLGGGSVFFYLKPKGHSFLSDLNGELIETYQALKEDVDSVIKILKTYCNSEIDYYNIRDKKYNSIAKRAAKFIYLNQTSYNGIYRVNLKGVYNVPYGFRKKDFVDEENLKNVSKALANTTFIKSDFEYVLQNLQSKDLVFLDPPYTVSHNNNGFIKYNEKIFSLEDQFRLSNLIDKIKKKGAFYILTNAAHKNIDEIFEKGDKKIVYQRASLIGGNNSKRGSISEFVFTNTII